MNNCIFNRVEVSINSTLNILRIFIINQQKKLPNKSVIPTLFSIIFLLVEINSFSQWTETDFLTGGKIVSIESSQNTTYTITSGGIYSNGNNESVWNKISPRFFNTNEITDRDYLAFECENNLLLLSDFTSTNPTFYRKLPDSLVWDTLFPSFQGEVLDIEHFNDSLFTLVFNQNNLMLYTSSDSGTTWNLMQNIGATKPSSPKPMEVLGKQLYVEGSDNILNEFNTDSNRFKSIILNGLPMDRLFIDIAIIDTFPIILLKSNDSIQLYRLQGDTIWVKGDLGIDSLAQIQAISTISDFGSIYANKNNFVQVYSVKSPFTTWDLQSNLLSTDINPITYKVKSKDSLFYGNNLNLFLSADTGSSFSIFNDNILATNCLSGIQLSNKTYLSCQFDGLYESFNNLSSVNYAEPTLSSVNFSKIYLNDSKLYYFVNGVNSEKLLTSNNNGSQWFNSVFPAVNSPSFLGFDSSSLYIKGSISASSDAMYRTDNNGENWINLTSNYIAFFNLVSSFAEGEKGTLYCTGNTDNLNWRILRSTNKGQSWQESLSGLPLTIPSRLHLLSTQNLTLLYGTWVGEDQLYLRVSNSWSILTNSNFPTLDELFYEGEFEANLKLLEGIHYLSFSNGIYKSLDLGLTWEDYTTGIPLNSSIKGLFETNSNLVAITQGVGNYEIDKLGGITPKVEQTITPIFPSISSGIFNINSIENYSKIEVYSITGQKAFSADKSLNQFDLSEFNSGVYVVRIVDKSNKLHVQLITLQK
ncbi:MAG: hypothetical protein ACJAZ3_001476 [Sphingobacteriales bacterium]|jgi:hypothetical protein